jgi:hypothetical protein
MKKNRSHAMLPVGMKIRLLLGGIVIAGVILGAGCGSSEKDLSGDQLFEGQRADQPVAPSLLHSDNQIQGGVQDKAK